MERAIAEQTHQGRTQVDSILAVGMKRGWQARAEWEREHEPALAG